MQVFTNLVLGKTWKTSINRLSPEVLAGRVEPIGLERIPTEIVLLTVGADVQDDRIEVCLLGWPLAGAPAVLAHTVIDGNTLEDATWAAFDEFLHSCWPHSNGWSMKVDAAAVDSGGHEGRTQKVYDFCAARLHRRVYAIRGVGGARAIWTRSQRVKSGKMARLFIVGHDQVKTAVLELLSQEPFDAEGQPNPHALRISGELPEDWFDQATGEIRRVKCVRNRAVIEAAGTTDRGAGRAVLRLGGAAGPRGAGDRLARPSSAPAATSCGPIATAPSFSRIVGKAVQWMTTIDLVTHAASSPRSIRGESPNSWLR